jgi:hypothetical protein
MTTNSICGVAGPFTALNPLTPAGNGFALVEKTTSTNSVPTPLVLPAGAIVTEIQIKRSGDITLLTAGKSIAIGVFGDARVFTGTPGALTDNLNTNTDVGQIINVNPTTNITGIQSSYTTDKNLVCQCALGASITAGSICVVIKYKSYSKSVAYRY